MTQSLSGDLGVAKAEPFECFQPRQIDQPLVSDLRFWRGSEFVDWSDVPSI